MTPVARPGADHCDLPALRQRELLRDGEISVRELLDAHLRRIEQLEPSLNAFRTLAADLDHSPPPGSSELLQALACTPADRGSRIPGQFGETRQQPLLEFVVTGREQ